MKNVLDHRILLPKSPEIVWQYISDLSNNTAWQSDCEKISFLTSRHSGVGVRWRYQSPDKHDRVVETTAWYEGLGYEYAYIEGAPFLENRGRIRLQEIPEGTVVQWTFSYDTKGVLGSLRNTINIRRQTEKVMMDSLRMLWRKLNQSGSADSVREVKSLMRDAPGYEERSRYKPRHPSKMDGEAQPEVETTQPASVIIEPPISEEDTRPSVRAALPPEPEFLSQINEPSEDLPVAAKETTVDESIFMRPEPSIASVEEVRAEAAETPAVEEPVHHEQSAIEHLTPDHTVETSPPPAAVSPELTDHEPTTAREMPADEAADFSKETTKTSVVELPMRDASSAPTQIIRRESTPPEKLEKMDTREISVFEIFGLPKPSESQELAAVVPAVSQPDSLSSPSRMGLRILLRRKLVKLRRPS